MYMKIKRKMGDIVRNVPVIRDQPWIFEVLGLPTETRKYLDSLNSIVKSDRYLEILKKTLNATSTNSRTDFDELHKSFRRLQVRSSRLPKNWWESFIGLASTTDAEAGNLPGDMISHTRNLDPEDLTVYEWKALYSLCLRGGLFNIGYIMRDLAKKRALKALEPGNKNFTEKKLAIAAAIEDQEFDEARRAISDLRNTGKYDDYCNDAEILLNIFTGGNLKRVELEDHTDLNYLDYVSQKIIAIVGPAQTEAMDAKEIDSFDRIVRNNYRESGKGCDSIHKGLRCDITYMNGMQADFFLKARSEFPRDLSWMVLKSKKFIDKFQKVNSITNIRFRYIKNWGRYFFNGSFNMLPNTLFDLIFFHPNRIKVFHMDLMLTVLRFKGYYPSTHEYDENKKKVRFCRSAVSHDPITQYSALSNLWKAGRIEGDKRFNEVMELGCEEYMRQLQHIYGDSVRLCQAEI